MAGNTAQELVLDDKQAKMDLNLNQQHSGVQVADVIEFHATEEEERKLLRKIDRYLMPSMALCYMLQLLDKLSLSYATQLGLMKDLHLVGSQYSWASSIFYFGYLIWSWPSSYVAVRLPLGKYLAGSVMCWGIVLTCHAGCVNFAGLLVARFFLGVTEAAVAPGFSLITGMFYTRKEQPLRHGIWFGGNCVANIVGGLIGYGIGHINSPIGEWRVLFLILGSITTAYSIVLLLVLPDSPAKARFFNTEEKKMALHRTLRNKTGIMDEDVFKPKQMVEALLDPQAWLLCLYTLSVNIPNGGITSFASLIIGGFGFSPLKSLLYQMPIGACQLVVLASASIVASRLGNVRLILMSLVCVISLVGMLLVNCLDHSNMYGRLVGIWLGAVFAANIPLSLSLIASNVAGFTKKATVAAMLFICYSVGNIIGPQFFLTSQKPTYQMGIRAVISGFCLAIFFLLVLLTYYIMENQRRDRIYGPPSQLNLREELAEEISNKTDRNIEHFRYVT